MPLCYEQKEETEVARNVNGTIWNHDIFRPIQLQWWAEPKNMLNKHPISKHCIHVCMYKCHVLCICVYIYIERVYIHIYISDCIVHAELEPALESMMVKLMILWVEDSTESQGC